jgi:hypothetical protein
VCGAQGGICRVNTFFQSRSLLFSLYSQRFISPSLKHGAGQRKKKTKCSLKEGRYLKQTEEKTEV